MLITPIDLRGFKTITILKQNFSAGEHNESLNLLNWQSLVRFISDEKCQHYFHNILLQLKLFLKI